MVAGETSVQSEVNLVVRGRARRVAIAVTVVLLMMALWAAKLDYDRPLVRNTVPLTVLSALFKGLALAGLLVVARRLASRSIYLIAGFVAALIAGTVIINSDALSTMFDSIADWAEPVLPVSGQTAKYVLMFSVLAVVTAVLLYLAYSSARPTEREAVLVLIGLLLVVGVFVGPVNALSIQGWSREWLFAEDFGQVVSLALLTGYTSGLVVASSHRS